MILFCDISETDDIILQLLIQATQIGNTAYWLMIQGYYNSCHLFFDILFINQQNLDHNESFRKYDQLFSSLVIANQMKNNEYQLKYNVININILDGQYFYLVYNYQVDLTFIVTFCGITQFFVQFYHIYQIIICICKLFKMQIVLITMSFQQMDDLIQRESYLLDNLDYRITVDNLLKFTEIQQKILLKYSKLFMMIFASFIYLYGLLYLINSSHVACNDQHCSSCGYDCSYDSNDNCILDYTKSCLDCDYPWFINLKSCQRISCNTNFCTQCDSTGQYCIGCKPLYDLKIDGCQLKQYMVDIIIGLVLALLFILSCLGCWYYQKLQRGQIIEALQNNRNRSLNDPNSIIAIDQISNNNAERNKLYRMKNEERYVIPDSNSYCPICLEDNCEVISRCGHLFHAPCLYIWITNKNSCPLCNIGLIHIVEVITCLKCRDQTKQYNLLEFNNETIYKIEHNLCKNCCILVNQQKKQNRYVGENGSNKFHKSI